MQKKDVLRQVLRVLIGEVICVALMLAVYAIMHKLATPVLLGALVGSLIAIGNFLFLSIGVSRAADRAAANETEDAAAKATISVQRNSMLRMVALLVIYIIVLKSGYFDILASILPLVFVQVSIYLTEFFRKGGEKSNG